jgi:LacI family repressor for deo operon, udp, cdd, tsx, nupC, and nupG
MTGRVKIIDIARKLGVSPATVSRALSDTGLVAEPTLSRIRDEARALNYRPNVSARNLRTRRSKAVLMVVRDVGNPFYLEVLKGVEAAAREAGYAVLMGNTENDPERESGFFDMLRDGQADGMVLITGKLPQSKRYRDGLADNLPVVVALETIEGSGLPHIQIDNRLAAADAVRHLIDLGHTRIAHISGPLLESMSALRLQGFRDAMAAAGLPIPPSYEPHGDFSLAAGKRLCQDLLSLAEPPTAIFAANDEMAFGAIAAAHRAGLSVPADLSVIGFDDIYLSEAFQPALTTISQPRADVGRAAMTVLLDILAGKGAPAAPIVLPTTLQIRSSTAAPRSFVHLRSA